MKLRQHRWVVAGTLLLGSVAIAKLDPGAKVFVKARNTKLLTQPDANAKVVQFLQPGDAVLWQSGPENEFHNVALEKDGGTGDRGFVYFANLSQTAPVYEVSSDGGTLDPAIYRSKIAASKALSEGPIRYGKEKLNREDAVRAVITMEAISAKITDDKLVAFAKTNGLAPVVGPTPPAKGKK